MQASIARTKENLNKKRLVFFKLIYFIAGFLMLMYLWKFNFAYGVRDYNPILLPLALAYLSIPWVFLRKSYRAGALALIVATVLMANTLIFIAGGINAPGVIWLACFPPIMAVLTGRKGSYVSYILVTACYLIFLTLNAYDIGPNLIAKHGNYVREKAMNLFFFILFVCFTTQQYLIIEERNLKHFNEEKNDIENLLRLLLHDVANTLSTLTYSLVKAKEQSQSDMPPDFDRLEKTVEDIGNLLSQVRHIKSIKDGKIDLPLKPLSLTMILSELYESATVAATPKSIKIDLDLPRKNLSILGERTIITNLILMNLINNSIKFSHPGSRITIKVTTDEQKRHAEIRIIDHGIGIPQENLKDLFRFNSSTSRVGTQGEKGTGYGLPLVQEYLQLLGGKIEVSSTLESDSAPGETCFKVSFLLVPS